MGVGGIMNCPAASGGAWTHEDFVGATHGSPLRNLDKENNSNPNHLTI